MANRLRFTTNYISQARRGLGWSRSKLAAAAGISLRTLTYIEQGQVTPKVETLNRLRAVLKDVMY